MVESKSQVVRAHGIRDDDDDARQGATVRAWTNERVVSSSRSSSRGARACVGSVARDAIEFIDLIDSN